MPTPPTDTAPEAPPELSPAMQALQKAGQKLARANAARDRAITELRNAIRDADAEGGHTRAELITTAGVARQTVYDALRPDSASTEAAEAAQ